MADIFGNGVHQEDLVDLLALIVTNFNGILTKLDSDGIADTDYNATWAISLPAGINSTEKSIYSQGDIVTFLNNVIAGIAGVNAKLDADGTVNDTNFAALWDITDVVGGANDMIQDAGINQSALVNLLNDIIATIAGINAKLDADDGVTDTDYASLWDITDNVDEAGTVAA